MGDIADMLIEQMMDEGGEDWSIWDTPRKVLKCRACKKPNLVWRKVLDQWVMFEKNNQVHTCGGYEPPIEVLKYLATEVLQETRQELLWRLMDKAKRRGGLIKLLPILPDDQLVDLYACFVRDDCGEPDVGMNISYKREMALLREELLHRMNKKKS